MVIKAKKENLAQAAGFAEANRIICFTKKL